MSSENCQEIGYDLDLGFCQPSRNNHVFCIWGEVGLS